MKFSVFWFGMGVMLGIMWGNLWLGLIIGFIFNILFADDDNNSSHS